MELCINWIIPAHLGTPRNSVCTLLTQQSTRDSRPLAVDDQRQVIIVQSLDLLKKIVFLKPED